MNSIIIKDNTVLVQSIVNVVKARKLQAIAGEAIEKIEQNPPLTQRLLSAAKAGSLAAIESMLNHPVASFVIAAVQPPERGGETEDLNEE